MKFFKAVLVLLTIIATPTVANGPDYTIADYPASVSVDPTTSETTMIINTGGDYTIDYEQEFFPVTDSGACNDTTTVSNEYITPISIDTSTDNQLTTYAYINLVAAATAGAFCHRISSKFLDHTIYKRDIIVYLDVDLDGNFAVSTAAAIATEAETTGVESVTVDTGDTFANAIPGLAEVGESFTVTVYNTSPVVNVDTINTLTIDGGTAITDGTVQVGYEFVSAADCFTVAGECAITILLPFERFALGQSDTIVITGVAVIAIPTRRRGLRKLQDNGTGDVQEDEVFQLEVGIKYNGEGADESSALTLLPSGAILAVPTTILLALAV